MATTRTNDLSEVLYALALAMPVPDANTLDEFVRRYPQHADALTEFAVDLALEAGTDSEDDDGNAAGEISPAVSRAISHFQNVSFEMEKSSGAGAAEAVANPLANLSKEDFRAFAATLGANTTFVMKLRDRSIEPDTITSRTGFCRVVADGLDIPVDAMVAHLRAPSTVHAHAHYKADEKPAASRRETFEEAVRDSGLSPEQQKQLLDL